MTTPLVILSEAKNLCFACPHGSNEAETLRCAQGDNLGKP